jgi:uncharacterized protein
MRYAEDHKLKGSVLVGVCHTDLGDESEKQSGYYDSPWQWEKIRDNQEWTAIFASTDDPYIHVEEPRLVRDKLGSEYFEFTDKGHFSTHDEDTDRHKEFPELLKFLRSR